MYMSVRAALCHHAKCIMRLMLDIAIGEGWEMREVVEKVSKISEVVGKKSQGECFMVEFCLVLFRIFTYFKLSLQFREEHAEYSLHAVYVRFKKRVH